MADLDDPFDIPVLGEGKEDEEDPFDIPEVGGAPTSTAEPPAQQESRWYDELLSLADGLTLHGALTGDMGDDPTRGEGIRNWERERARVRGEHPVYNAAGSIASDTALSMAVPGGVAGQAALGTLAGGSSTYAATHDPGRTAASAGLGGVLGGAGAVAGKVLGRMFGKEAPAAPGAYTGNAGQGAVRQPAAQAVEAIDVPPQELTAKAVDPLEELLVRNSADDIGAAPEVAARQSRQVANAPLPYNEFAQNPKVYGPRTTMPGARGPQGPVEAIDVPPSEYSVQPNEDWTSELLVRNLADDIGTQAPVASRVPRGPGSGPAPYSSPTPPGPAAQLLDYGKHLPGKWGVAARGLGQLLPGASSKIPSKTAEATAVASAATLEWTLQSVISSGESGLDPQAEQQITEALISGDSKRVAALDYQNKLRFPAYAKRVEDELRSLNAEEVY